MAASLARVTCENGVCGSDPPGILVFDGRAVLVDTPYEVWQVIAAQERVPSPAALARELGLTHHQVRMALAYYELHPDEVDAQIATAGSAAGAAARQP